MPLTHSTRARDAICAAVTALVAEGTVYNRGRVVLFDSSGRPVARFEFADPAFREPSDGIADAYDLGADPHYRTDGLPVRFEAQDRAGLCIWRGRVGPGTGDLGPLRVTPEGLVTDYFTYHAPL